MLYCAHRCRDRRSITPAFHGLAACKLALAVRRRLLLLTAGGGRAVGVRMADSVLGPEQLSSGVTFGKRGVIWAAALFVNSTGMPVRGHIGGRRCLWCFCISGVAIHIACALRRL